MRIRRRSMKENALSDERARISSIRHRDRRGHLKDERAIRILSSSKIAKAVLSKKGYRSESV